MTCPTSQTIAIHRTLEAVFSDPRTWGYFGNNAKAEPKTIGTAQHQTGDLYRIHLSERPALSERGAQ